MNPAAEIARRLLDARGVASATCAPSAPSAARAIVQPGPDPCRCGRAKHRNASVCRACWDGSAAQKLLAREAGRAGRGIPRPSVRVPVEHVPTRRRFDSVEEGAAVT